MNILILNWRDPKNPLAGGAEIVTFEHAKAWVNAGHNVTWFSPRFFNSVEKEKIEGINMIRKGNSLTVYLYAPFYYFFSNSHFDLVIDQIHGIPFFTPLYVRTKKIAFIHEVAGEIWDYMYPFPLNKLGKFIESIYFKFYKNIIFWTCSESTVNDLQAYGIKKSQCFIIPNGIANNPITKLPQKADVPTFIFVNRIVKMKGIEDVLEAFFYIKQEFVNAQLWIVGTGERNYVERIKMQVDKMGLKKHVTFLGFVAESKKLALMQKSHLLLHASVKEGWGLVIIEAASQATPSIVYNVGGLRDSVNNNITGIIVKKNEPKEIANESIKLLKNKERYISFQKNCLSIARKLTWGKILPVSLRLITQQSH